MFLDKFTRYSLLDYCSLSLHCYFFEVIVSTRWFEFHFNPGKTVGGRGWGGGLGGTHANALRIVYAAAVARTLQSLL